MREIGCVKSQLNRCCLMLVPTGEGISTRYATPVSPSLSILLQSLCHYTPHASQGAQTVYRDMSMKTKQHLRKTNQLKQKSTIHDARETLMGEKGR